MSFSKAKIQRFNDVKASIAGANKQLSEKPKSKPKAINVHQCDKSAEKDKSDTASSQSVPCFRTPTLLKKKLKFTSTASNHKPTTELYVTDQNLEALKDKIVECENKDAFIKDLTKQLDDFKEEINKIEKDKQSIENERSRYEKIIENLQTEYSNNINTIQNDFKKRLFDTRSLKDQISEQLSFLKTDFEKFQTFYFSDIQDLKNHCSELPVYFKKYSAHYQSLFDQKQAELHHQENILKILEQNSIEMQKQHSLEIEKLRKEHQIEVQDLEFEMLKTMTELQKEKEVSSAKVREMEEEINLKMAEMRKVFETEKEQIRDQSELKIKQLEKSLQNSNCNSGKDVDEELGKLQTEWKNRLIEQEKQSDAILRECQAISEYNIIQCTIEKNTVITELKGTIEELKGVKVDYEELANNFKELKTTYEELKSELASKKQQLDELKRELKTELEKYNKMPIQTLKEKSAYEFTIKNSQATIEVLTKRLIHSDKDVEQLKEELSECEKKLLDYEQKNLQLSTELKQTQIFNEELDMQFESTIKLNCKDIDNVTARLVKDVSDYKKQVVLYKQQFKDEEGLKKEMMQQLHDAYDMINRLKLEFDKTESVCCQYKFEVEQSQNELEDYHMREMDWNIIKDKLESTIKELEDLLEAKSYEISNLKIKIDLLEQKSNSILQRSDYYKQKIKELELEQIDTNNIHKKYIDLSGKYDFLSYKYEELEQENLQNKMKLMKLSDERCGDDLKEKFDSQVTLCTELEQKNDTLEQNIQRRLQEESALKSDYMTIKSERGALLNKVKELETDLQRHLASDARQSTKKSRKINDEDKDPKKWIKKTKSHKSDKENVNSPNRTLNSSRIDSPLRERN